MNKVIISRIQMVILVIAIIYVVMPDIFFGPIDDAAITGITTISEIILGIMKKQVSNQEMTYNNVIHTNDLYNNL